MDILRRNTDYALRLMINLARNYGSKPVSSRMMAEDEQVSYQLTCKILQKLHAAGFISSKMGPRGGFILKKAPSEITLAEIVRIIQGPITVNSCLLRDDFCPRKSICSICNGLSKLQLYIDEFFKSMTLEQLIENREGN